MSWRISNICWLPGGPSGEAGQRYDHGEARLGMVLSSLVQSCRLLLNAS